MHCGAWVMIRFGSVGSKDGWMDGGRGRWRRGRQGWVDRFLWWYMNNTEHVYFADVVAGV